ncbi:cytochrome P450 2D4-like [Lampetra planeri]
MERPTPLPGLHPEPRLEGTSSDDEALGILTATYDHSWKQQRRFAVSTLRNGKTSLKEKISEEVAFLLQTFRESERCQREIDDVIGSSRAPATSDTASMPYTVAVIHEVQRMANVLPTGFMHATASDVIFRGFHIPKGTIVIPNLTSVLYDENHWKTLLEFNPGHFLNDAGQFVKPDAFLPFSAGPCVCLGENLAKMEIFLFFTSLMRRFQFYWPDPESQPCLAPAIGALRSPQSYQLGIRQRPDK